MDANTALFHHVRIRHVGNFLNLNVVTPLASCSPHSAKKNVNMKCATQIYGEVVEKLTRAEPSRRHVMTSAEIIDHSLQSCLWMPWQPGCVQEME